MAAITMTASTHKMRTSQPLSRKISRMRRAFGSCPAQDHFVSKG
jgi:hypothetical protein